MIKRCRLCGQLCRVEMGDCEKMMLEFERHDRVLGYPESGECLGSYRKMTLDGDSEVLPEE